MTAISKIANENIKINYIPDTRKNPSDYTQVVFYDKSTKDYFHSWVLTDTTNFKNYTQIVFGYISKSKDFESGKRINKDFDFLTNYLTKRRFEELVISKLELDVK